MSAGNLTDQLLVNAADVDDRGLGQLERDAIVAPTMTGGEKPSVISSLPPLSAGTVTDANELEGLGIPFAHADDHVVDERTVRPCIARFSRAVIGALDDDGAVLAQANGHILVEGLGELTPWDL